MVKRNRKSIGLAATQPRLGKRNTISNVSSTQRAHGQREFLSVAHRQRSPSLLIEDVAHGEIGELQTCLQHQISCGETSRETNLVGCGFLHGIADVNGVVGRIGLHIWVNGLLIEETERGQLTDGAHHVTTAEQLSRTGVKLTQNHMVVGFGVAHQRHVADASLFTFSETDFKVDGIVFDSHFHRVDAEEEVAVVHIQRTDIQIGLAIIQVLVKQLLIIYVALLNAQDGVEGLISVFGVTRPADVTIVVFVAFVNDNVNAEVVFINTIHRIADDTCIAVAFSIVFLDDMLLIVLVVLFDVFRSLEDTRAVVVVEVFLHAIDGSQRMQGEHICDRVHNHRAQWIQWVEVATLFGFLHCT